MILYIILALGAAGLIFLIGIGVGMRIGKKNYYAGEEFFKEAREALAGAQEALKEAGGLLNGFGHVKEEKPADEETYEN